MQKAGFQKFPATTAEFLDYAKATKKNNTPGGFALGHASGDGNAWVHWCLWAHGGNLVDKDDKVILNSPETAKALEYAKQLYDNMIPGTASWNDASNNKAFLGGEINWTDNGISIYVAAQRDPKLKPIADDMDHAVWPVGPVGKPTEFHLMYPLLAMTYTKYPQASKALMAFMLEADNFNPWLEGAQGYLTHCLNAYNANPVWKADPKRTIFGEAGKRTLTAGGLGSVGEKAATAIADFLVLDMFANYCTGREDVKGAMAVAERQAKRIYR
jgi:multiple sugar transport system substrate-binding protein